MELKQALKDNKEKILKKWFQATIDTYPEQTAKILGKSTNRFDNPVAASTMDSLKAVVDLLSDAFDFNTMEKALDSVIRVRAVQVQAFEAAKGITFIFALKEIGEQFIDKKDFRAFDRLVDQIALAAFNKFMKCKEEIFLLKATESKRRIHRAFERAGLVTELKEEDLLGSNKY